MTATHGEDPRARVARYVAERRKAISLSVAAAARSAGVDRGTWIGLEKGTRETEEYLFARIEKVLAWRPGSIDAILADGEPAIEQPAAAPPLPDDEAITAVMRSTKIPEDQKRKIIAILIEDRERERKRRLALAEDLIRTWEDAS